MGSTCPARPALDLGYPENPPPRASAFPPRAMPPGEQASAQRLIEVVEQLLADWQGDIDLLRDPRTALVVGTGGFLYASGAELYWRSRRSSPAPYPFRVCGPHWGATLVAQHLQLTGPVFTLSTSCSSSANALLMAHEMLGNGEVDRAIVIGAEELSTITLSGFASLMLLDDEGCRPFDRDRAGLRLGEALTALMLEPDRPDAPRITGGANLCDTHHMTSATPDGQVMAAVMGAALVNARCAAPDIQLIKAHGTGSVDSDRAESCALHALFGSTLPPIVGLKGHLGHTLGACGTLEVAAMLGCHAAGFIPHSAGFSTIDEECGIEPTRRVQPSRPGRQLFNFFGFGGNYTALVMEP